MTAAEVATPAETGAEILARIRPVMRREETYLCLRADLIDRWEAANEELGLLHAQDLDNRSGARLAAGAAKQASAEVRKKAAEVKALEDEIEATQVRFVMEKMDKPTWSALTAEHPPRKENMVDHALGYNREAVYEEAVRICLVEPVFDDASYADLLKALGPSEWAELRDLAERVNGKVVHAPKSALAASILTRANSRRSRPPKVGE